MLMAWAALWSAQGRPDGPLGPDRATDHPPGPTTQDQMVAPRAHPPDDRGLWTARSTPPS